MITNHNSTGDERPSVSTGSTTTQQFNNPMAQTSKFKSLFFWILLITNVVFAFPLLSAFFAGYLHPSFGHLAFFAGLGFRYILIANFVFLGLWLIFDYRFCLISAFLILLNVNTIDKHFQFHGREVPETAPNCVKVLTYNTQLFGLYKDADMVRRVSEKQQIMNFLKEEQPAIACFQEFFWDKGESLNFHTTDEVLAALNLEDSDEHYYQYFTDTTRGRYYGLAIFSRYRIVNAEPVITDSSSNAIAFVDIKYRGDTIRVYNVHLTSLHMSADDYATSQQLTTDPTLNQNTKRLLKKLSLAAQKRQKQVDILRANMDSCRYPIILCGDFNDTPASYSYNTIARTLKDSFRESGKGFGHTYHGKHLPQYRIDNILHDKRYLSFGHTVGTKLKVSDHYPVIATISLQKRD